MARTISSSMGPMPPSSAWPLNPHHIDDVIDWGQSPGGGHALGLAYETRARLELTRGDSDALDPCVAQHRTSATRDTLSRTELMVASALAQARRGDPTARYRRLRPPHQLRGSGLRARVGDPNGRCDRQSERGSRRTGGDEFRSWLDLVADTPIRRPERVPPSSRKRWTALAPAGPIPTQQPSSTA
jgi:hypothetical protein